jgi:hypothetical protein
LGNDKTFLDQRLERLAEVILPGSYLTGDRIRAQ